MRFSSTFRRPLLGIALLLTLSCGGGEGGGTGPTPNPTPTISAIVRDSATAGVTPFSVIIGGANFMPGVVATFDGSARSTNRQSGSALDFLLHGADLATPGDHEIRLKNPEPGGGPSEALLFHVLPQPPVPVLDSLSPDTVPAGTAGPLLVKALGHGFAPGAVLKADGVPLPTTRVSDTLLQIQLVSPVMESGGAINFTVYKQGPGGGTSAARAFVVLPPPPPPVVTGITPDSVEVGPDTISVLIRGTRFTGATQVDFNNQGTTRSVTPTSVTDTSLVADLDRTWLSSLGNLAVKVHATSGTSAYFLAETYNPTPVITGFGPDTLDGSAAADTFFVIGTGFVPGMIVRVNGQDIQASTVVSFDTIRAIVTEGALLLGGTPPVTVFDTWDGRTSAPQAIAILSPAPTLDSIAPATRLAGVSGSHTLYGTNFRALGEILVNGVPRTATYFTPTGLVFPVDSAEISTAGTYVVAYRTPGPGGGTTDTISLTVVTPNPVPVVDSIIPGAVRSDSGVQIVAIHGHQFMPGTVVELHAGPNEFDPVDTLPMLSGDSTFATVEIPAPLLQAGRQLYLGLRAPEPTTATSPLRLLPVWTTGVRGISVVPGVGSFSWAGDTVRHLMYDVTVDGNTSEQATALVARDPTTGAVVKSLALPDHGARLFYGGASKYLYAICASGLKVCRIDLDAWTLDWAIDPFTINGNITVPVFIAPQDAHLGTFALSINMTGNEYGNWVRIYDGSVPRAPFDTLFSGVHSGRFFGDTLVMMNGYNGYRRTVTPGTQSPLDSVPLALNLGVPGRILSSTRALAGGHLMDLTSGNDLGAHPGFNTNYISTGPTAGRFYTAALSPTGPALLLYMFDLDTGAELRMVGIDGGYPESFGISPSNLPFLGYSGLGVRVVESIISDP